ncbi:peptidylprolyl isomerase [Marispirochaeta sp.]|uniref:foldase protein PrsA n=1 Tax=Marispirochaeta sp. TaxID=2038653 RepID=UPI0029C75B5D|nr:peptidylprolyl isomerase [Marispirochaeta sp.]
MKNVGCFFIATIAFILPLQINAAPLDGPAAMINLIRTEIITKGQLQQRVEETEEVRVQARLGIPPQTEKQVLDAMIAEILIQQAAERDGIAVSESEITAALNNQRKSAELQLQQRGELGASEQLPEPRFRELMEQQTRMSWEEIRESIRKQLLQQKYIMQTQTDLLDDISQPTEQEIQNRYKKMATSLINPEIIRFSQIFISTMNKNDAAVDILRERAEEIHKKLRQGADFSALVTEYTDDAGSRYSGGDFGYLARDDARAEAYFGKDFFTRLFNIDVNQVSGVMRSNIGFHIVKVTEHRDAKILSLNDPLSPTNQMTVREYISRLIINEEQQKALHAAYSRVVSTLRSEAEIQVFE